jgi:hypothetical protein
MILQYYRNIMEIICLYIYCKLRDIEHKNIKNALSSNFDKSFIKYTRFTGYLECRTNMCVIINQSKYYVKTKVIHKIN